MESFKKETETGGPIKW